MMSLGMWAKCLCQSPWQQQAVWGGELHSPLLREDTSWSEVIGLLFICSEGKGWHGGAQGLPRGLQRSWALALG